MPSTVAPLSLVTTVNLKDDSYSPYLYLLPSLITQKCWHTNTFLSVSRHSIKTNFKTLSYWKIWRDFLVLISLSSIVYTLLESLEGNRFQALYVLAVYKGSKNFISMQYDYENRSWCLTHTLSEKNKPKNLLREQYSIFSLKTFLCSWPLLLFSCLRVSKGFAKAFVKSLESRDCFNQ